MIEEPNAVQRSETKLGEHLLLHALTDLFWLSCLAQCIM